MSPASTQAARARGQDVTLVVLVGLYLLALTIRLLVATQIPMAATEPSAYYADVAMNLVAGDGLVSHSVWSYATPPLVVPKPAFELWLPMSTFVSALGMLVLGPTWWAAQVAHALLGALAAPLAWGVGRGAARGVGLDTRRGGAVAMACGLLAALLAPFVLAAAVPDSFTPFLVFGLLAALLTPPMLGVRDGLPASPGGLPRWKVGGALGVALGLAYLSRQEAIWIGLTVLLMLGASLRTRAPGARVREALDRLWPIVLGGGLVVLPWFARNVAAFGTLFPGQALENMFLVRNEDIFAFDTRPSLHAYLEQGLATVLGNPLAGAWAGLWEVLLLSAFPVGLVGLVSLVGLRRSAALRRPTSLVALLMSGGLTFLAAAVLFPVATRWGTFMHASGPLIVGLVAAAALGADQLVARMSARRRWKRPNIVIGPVALVVVSLAFGLLQWGSMSAQAQDRETRYAALATAIANEAARQGQVMPETLISDHPVWLADALARNVVALPDEDLASLGRLAQRFEAPWVVVIDGRGGYPAALLAPSAEACLDGAPVTLEARHDPALLFRLAETCPGT